MSKHRLEQYNLAGFELADLAHKFANHSSPLPVVILEAVLIVSHDADCVVELELTLVDNFLEQVNAVSIETIVAFSRIVVHFHYKGRFLTREALNYYKETLLEWTLEPYN